MKQRKNKVKQAVVWPTATLFSIKELHRLNPKFVNITLRVRLMNAISEGKVAEIGAIPGENGRPQKVFSMTPVTRLTLCKARAERINMVDNADQLVQVISVSTSFRPISTPTIDSMSKLTLATSS